jgi:hypothetical protein
MKTDRNLKALTVVAVAALAVMVSGGCDYIIPPYEPNTPTPGPADNGWAGIVTNVTETGGALRVDLSIVNNTNDWSAMDVAATTAQVTDSSGSSHDCGKAFVGTAVFVNNGGWYLPPGFVMKGYTGGSVSSPETQLLYVECSGVSKGSGQTLTINYKYIVGPFNYYVASKPVSKTMKLALDKVVTDQKYPVAEKLGTLTIEKAADKITGINNCTIRLVSAKRTDTGFEFDWDSFNPTEYPAFIHIGIPPVIGSDGILYGFYETPILADVPITPAGGDAQWSTTVTAPKDVTGFYVLLPLESRQEKYFIDHALDISDL